MSELRSSVHNATQTKSKAALVNYVPTAFKYPHRVLGHLVCYYVRIGKCMFHEAKRPQSVCITKCTRQSMEKWDIDVLSMSASKWGLCLCVGCLLSETYIA